MLSSRLSFEQGPIRPPNEAHALLLRITRNCSWNQCLFCPVYKGQKFTPRKLEEIKKDIDNARMIFDDIKALSFKQGMEGEITEGLLHIIYYGEDYSDSYRSVALWAYYGTQTCFLQDADNLILKTDDLKEILAHLKTKFPDLKRITTYARSRSILHKSLEELKRLKVAGLDRIHIGMESAHDPLLKFVKKGVTKSQHVEAGQKVVASGIELSEYVMPGLGGTEMSSQHAIDTADALNQINPHFIRLRTLRIPGNVPLNEKRQAGEFNTLSEDLIIREIKLFLKNLNGITSRITSDHFMNLLEEINGKYPEDKKRLIDVANQYLNLPDEDRLLFQMGRRQGLISRVSDLNKIKR